MAANRGFHGLRDGERQAALMALTRRGTMDLFRSGELGRSTYLVDTFALTRAANSTGSKSLVSADGHHYPTAVRQLEMAITYLAYRLHRLGLALGPRGPASPPLARRALLGVRTSPASPRWTLSPHC